MQLSVKPHITIYGDVKESEVNKGTIREKLGLLDNKSVSQSKALTVDLESSLTKAEVKSDLMKVSGQVGKPILPPLTKTY